MEHLQSKSTNVWQSGPDHRTWAPPVPWVETDLTALGHMMCVLVAQRDVEVICGPVSWQRVLILFFEFWVGVWDAQPLPSPVFPSDSPLSTDE